MAVNTDPFSDPFGSKEVEVGRDSLFAVLFLDPPGWVTLSVCVCVCLEKDKGSGDSATTVGGVGSHWHQFAFEVM